MSIIDLNNLTPSFQPGPQSKKLSDHMFEGDLPESKTFEPNILDAGENMVIKSLSLMREATLRKGNDHFVQKCWEDLN